MTTADRLLVLCWFNFVLSYVADSTTAAVAHLLIALVCGVSFFAADRVERRS